jgi:hypothetical protein
MKQIIFIHGWCVFPSEEKLFDHIIVRSLEKDALAGDNFLTQRDFRDNIITVIKHHLSQ